MSQSNHEIEQHTISLLTLKLTLPGCGSLKQKRSLLSPILARLHKEFNLSAAEIGLQDIWQSAWLGCTLLSTDADHNARVLNKVVAFVETHFPEIQVEEFHLETR
ncbi:MAG: DUF503 domain-containing protein [Ignavibacteria bacterium]|nr:DUF503 domain-containing protein [Ignavibacteria bacterium]